MTRRSLGRGDNQLSVCNPVWTCSRVVVESFSQLTQPAFQFNFHFPSGEIKQASDKQVRLNEQKVLRSGEGMNKKEILLALSFLKFRAVLEMNVC